MSEARDMLAVMRRDRATGSATARAVRAHMLAQATEPTGGVRQLPRPSGDWAERAACRGMGPDTFYPGRGESSRPARAVCAACPVAEECRDWAMSAPERFGVWGGMSERQRRRIRERRRKSAGGPGGSVATGGGADG